VIGGVSPRKCQLKPLCQFTAEGVDSCVCPSSSKLILEDYLFYEALLFSVPMETQKGGRENEDHKLRPQIKNSAPELWVNKYNDTASLAGRRHYILCRLKAWKNKRMVAKAGEA
jgi:hypothetical protein